MQRQYTDRALPIQCRNNYKEVFTNFQMKGIQRVRRKWKLTAREGLGIFFNFRDRVHQARGVALRLKRTIETTIRRRMTFSETRRMEIRNDNNRTQFLVKINKQN